MATDPMEVPPPLQGPTAKEKKYDRQLRLWGANGQIALEETHVLLIQGSGTGVTGIETLKNLVLPGIGHFTILDSAIVDEADLGVNFFLEDASLGKYRAEETVKYLVELNPDVAGHAITEPLESWALKDKIFTPYTLVLVAAPIDPTILKLIATHTEALQIPTFHFHSLGYYSHFSIGLPPAFPIVDTHPDPTATTDLRLTKPWSELTGFAREKTANMENMNGEEFAHIPYVCLLLHYLERWQSEHNGSLPDTYKEKTAFRDLVRSGSGSEENFDEAVAAVLKSLNPPTPPSAVREILSAPEATKLTASSPPFWLIANAVQTFYSKHSQLPLPGAVPDMKARSDTYIQLQNIYKQKARQDCAEVISSVRELEAQTDRAQHLSIPDAEIENFCKMAAHISLVRGQPLRVIHPDAPISFSGRAKFVVQELTNPESLVGLYIAFLAWDEFVATHHAGNQTLTPPGLSDTSFEDDCTRLTGIAHKMIDTAINNAGTRIEEPEYSQARSKVEKWCIELTRAGGGELHNIAALTGGLIAQEAIKVITRQYVPVQGACVFDGVGSRTWVGQL
ncbi:unnamed protein product [Zymoseptoria tritici ST99CH_1A5]|uniref:NEDD8-activating enzyme E1 regulatory subunit n=1 Tax=Zymoseptoria tritici ST99CH_1A5 TaxID=1276529 RepID=A0A1Y6LT27_ZYMTR|nr:unnamed protein product [Zymoseptoria tritici ST99CH_1A5]